jgi:hypothetical protein
MNINFCHSFFKSVKNLVPPILTSFIIYKSGILKFKPNKIFCNDERGIISKNPFLEKDLNYHIVSLEHHMDHLINNEQLILNFVLKSKEKTSINKTFHNYKVIKELNHLHKQTKKINKILKTYLNKLESLLEKDSFTHDLDFNYIIEQIKRINEIKTLMIKHPFYEEKSPLNFQTSHTLMNFVFHENESIIMRLLALLVAFYKNSHENEISAENLTYIIDLCKKKLNIKENEGLANEAYLYYAKKVLINLLSRKDYFYQDFILEINQTVNYREFEKVSYLDLNKKHESIVKDDRYFDYDIVFICGLNANFSKSWRVPKEEPWKNFNYKDKMNYYIHGSNLEKIFAFPVYELWIPSMFESSTFPSKKIRYLVTCAETKIFTQDLVSENIPDFTIDQISERIYNSFKRAGIGRRPLIVICHSMGGLITKRVLKLAESDTHNNNYDLIKNLRGVVFFSTPHFGSDVVTTLLDAGVKSISKIVKQFETTSVEYGLQEEDIKNKFSDVPLTNATKEICLTPKEIFIQQHEEFRKLNLNYICMLETEKTFIRGFNSYIHLVDPISATLPETENIILHGKKHGNLQKFSPDNFEEEGYKQLVKFIIEKLK